MDQIKRRRLIEKASAMLVTGNQLCAVTLDDFFDGNSDEQSIGVNLPPEKHIGLTNFRRILYEIQRKQEVQDVFIELHEIPDPDEEFDQHLWPTGWVVFIVTDASREEVGKWVQPLFPRDVAEGWNVRPGVAVPLSQEPMRAGMRPVRVWLG